ncbi:MAG TPA: hypothetical protein VL147_01615 [Devosia sp.]|nr:hypothetical protein [Devosia sp.]
MMTDKLIHKVNEASDAVDRAKAMVWAAFFVGEGMKGERSDAICSCCNDALTTLGDAIAILESIADGEREKEGA